jgi:hypothetical protein
VGKAPHQMKRRISRSAASAEAPLFCQLQKLTPRRFQELDDKNAIRTPFYQL